MSNFHTENARIRCKFSARSTCNAPELRPASLRKHFDVAEFLRRVCDGCDAEHARMQRSNMRRILPKFASLTHELAAIFFTISARGAPNFASSFARILIYNSHDVGAASPQVSAVLRAEKTARSAIAHFFSTRKLANSLRILRAVDTHCIEIAADVAAKTF